MMGFLLRLFGGRMVHKAVGNQVGGLLDVKLGFALLRDGRVPLKAKISAFGLAAAIIAALVALELPLEFVFDLLMPFLALPEAFVDGFELFVGPVLLACLALPYLAPPPLVQLIRDERAGNVIDAEILDAEVVETPQPTRRPKMRMNIAG